MVTARSENGRNGANALGRWHRRSHDVHTMGVDVLDPLVDGLPGALRSERGDGDGVPGSESRVGGDVGVRVAVGGSRRGGVSSWDSRRRLRWGAGFWGGAVREREPWRGKYSQKSGDLAIVVRPHLIQTSRPHRAGESPFNTVAMLAGAKHVQRSPRAHSQFRIHDDSFVCGC